MDPTRFDDLVRSLTQPASRRAVLGLAVGGLATLGLDRVRSVDAKHHHHHHHPTCKPGETKCGTACCKANQSCVNGTCVTQQTCNPGETTCGTQCCTATELCADGACVTGQGTCTTGADTCSGVGDPFCFDATGNHECICLTRLQGGTRCGVYGNKSACDQCLNDGDCLALGFPAGSSCTQDFGSECQACLNNSLGSCILPCGVTDPT